MSMRVRLGAIVVVGGLLQSAGACDCGEDIRTLEPDIDASPREIALSQQIVGAAITSTVQVGNRGNGVLELRTSIEPATARFRVVEAPDEVAPETAGDVVV